MRWNEEEEVGRRCVVDGVVIVGVDGVDGVCRRILDQVLRVGSLGVDDDRGSRCRCRRPGVLAAMVTDVSCGLFPMHVSAACVCTVPDVDACALHTGRRVE